ncbi:MAG: 30S ribosomal protein S6 [Candidatus Pacebacteria bacterium]|nr:30S ribosomal protein S6 [Candidatus Paceibacterota bacterium]
MQRFYELTYLASPVLEEKELEALKEKVKGFISNNEGEIESEISPVKVKLGYPIKKFKEGFLVTLEFNYSPQKIEELDKMLKQEKHISRHLILQKKRRIIKTESPKEKKAKKPKKVELKELDKKLKEILEE